MNCPSCNNTCVPDANYCHICGLKLNGDSAKSPSVAETLKRLMPGSYVDKLLASRGNSTGERRVVTILFSDIKGSTEMGENLDPEEVLTIMNKAFEVLIQPIMKYEGTLARLMGDAILAFFGAPIAHEDDQQRACRAALEIISGAEEFSKKLEREKGIKGFSVRVGINTGLVVVAEVGADFRVEYTAMGDAVNVASRMESAAEPGTILITEETSKALTDNFDLLSMGSIQVKGRKGAVNAYRVLSEKISDRQILLKNKNYLPLKGRSSELQKMLDALKTVSVQNNGKVISITGDCGIGKTRLALETHKLTSSDFEWLEIRSLAYQQNNSFWLIKSLIRNHLGDATLEGKNFNSVIRHKLKTNQKKLSEITSGLAYLLDIKEEGQLSFGYDENDPEALRGQIHFSVIEYLKNLTLSKPVVLLLEDLQWCDSSSLDLITEFFVLTEKYPVVLINTFRKEDSYIWDIHLKSLKSLDNRYLEINLTPLDSEASKEILEETAGELPFTETLVSEILIRAEGNPFFIEQIVKAYSEKYADDKDAVNGHNIAINDPEIPNLLQSVIMSRLDFLLPHEKMVLQTAAVIGRTFTEKLLIKILNNFLTIEEIRTSIELLIKREFIIQQDYYTGISEPGGIFMFVQSIIQEVAYSSLLLSSREKTHLAAAEAFEQLYKESTGNAAGTLAIHFEKGKNYKRALHYYLIAAAKAKSMFAAKEAILFYTRILNLEDLIPSVGSILQEVHESLGDINLLTSEYLDAITEYEEALRIVTDTRKKGVIYQKCGQVYEKWGQYENALQHYDLSLNQEDNSDKNYKAQILNGKGMVYFRQGNLEQAEYFSRQALKLIEADSNSYQLSECYNLLGLIYARNSELDCSEEYLGKALNIRKVILHLSGLAASYNNLGFLYHLKKDDNKAIENYILSIEFCEKTGNSHGLAKIYDNLSEIYIKRGEADKAISFNLLAMEILGRLTFKSRELNHHIWLQEGVW